MHSRLDIFCACLPGLEPLLREEMLATGFSAPKTTPGGVTFKGRWQEIWRANYLLRGASRVMVRLADFPAPSLPALESGAASVPWDDFLRPRTALRFEATCKKSKVYHTGAVVERMEKAAARTLGSGTGEDPFLIQVRLDHDQCTVSLDTSGDLLHRRGAKRGVGKAPLRETQAAMFLRACQYSGQEPLIDPFCGSGTIPLEAADMALGLAPGRAREFTFMDLPSFDAEIWESIANGQLNTSDDESAPPAIHGFDRDAGAVRLATENIERAGVAPPVIIGQQAVTALRRPEGPPGLILTNPPYGNRIGEADRLRGLYQSLGQRLTQEFSGWRVGIITSDDRLAQASRLPFTEVSAPVPHGPLRIRLHKTDPLP